MNNLFTRAVRNRSRRSSDQRRSRNTVGGRRRCLIESLEGRRLLTATIGNNISVGTELQNFRIAVAATAEYTAFFGGQSQAFAAIETLIDEVNEIFEEELSIHLDIVSDLDVVFTDSATDGYTNGNVSQMLSVNTSILNAEYGSAFYDVGHVLGTTASGGSGLAGLGVVNSTGKGRAASVSSSPSGASFVELFTHELGHQFGADHTFNANAFGSAQGNREFDSAYEPASGSTLMGYPGISGADDLQSDPDRYFHAASFEQVQTLIDNFAPPNSVTPTGNAVPSVSGGTDYVIPAGTPFALTASGSDSDSTDTLTYTWEQLDLGPAMSLPLFDNGSSPLFRSFEPSEDATRVFPRLADLTGNVNTAAIGEVLPSTTRDLNFRTTVRDGNGGVHSDDVLVSVIDTGSAFAVTSPNTSVNWAGGSSQTIMWNVAGTDSNGINVANVAIDLSVDGGMTYSIPLLASTTNDGSETITVPNIDVSEARLRIRSLGNVFFDISDANFVITPNSSVAGFTVAADDGSTVVGEPGLIGSSPIDQYTLAPNTPVNGAVEVTIDSDSQTEVSLDGVNFASSITLSYSNASPQTIFVRGLDDAAAEGMHSGTLTHRVTASTAAAYPLSTTINPLLVEVADDEWQPLVGVDFDQSTGSSPNRWTLVSEPFDSTESNLIREDGLSTGIGLVIDRAGSAGVNPSSYSGVPVRSPDLTGVDGVRSSSDGFVMTWTGLSPSTDYNIYVMAGEFFGNVEVDQDVSVIGSVSPDMFSQANALIGNGLLINGSVAETNRALDSDAVIAQSTATGEITIRVGGTVASAYLSGVAIQAVGPSVVGFNVEATGGSTSVSESGSTDTINVTLKTAPTGTVVIDVTGDDSTEAVVSPGTLTFDASNWDIPQVVTVTGVDDSDSDGATSSNLRMQINPSLTTDTDYVGVAARTLVVSTTDNEATSIVGVDFEDSDAPNLSPANWTLIDSPFRSTHDNLIREDGSASPFDLAIDVSGGSGLSDTNSPAILPDHTPSLAEIAGTRFSRNSITLNWSDLSPGVDYNLWLFLTWPFSNPIIQDVTITGEGPSLPSFRMDVDQFSGSPLLVNSMLADSARNLQADAIRATANASGEIEIFIEYVGTDSDGYAGLSGAAIQELAPVVPPTATVSVNNGGDQRSSLDQVQITFDQIVDIDTINGNAIEIVEVASGVAVTQIANIDNSTGVTVVDITFDPTDSLVSAGASLLDGDYRLTLDASLITAGGTPLDGDGDGTPGGDLVVGAVDGFFRKYGDIDGNGVVDLTDFSRFRAAFGTMAGDSGFEFGFDADGNGTISLPDFGQFRSNFGT